MTKEIIKISKSPEETFHIAQELALNEKNSCLIGLIGELGVGKTVFAKGYAHGLGIKDLILSPTFLGISEYKFGKIHFVHMDFFKKVTPKEILDFYLKSEAIVLIEWAENFKQLFNKELDFNISVYIQYVEGKKNLISENERHIIIKVKV